MSDTIGSFINEARSAVNTGEGAQYNFYLEAAATRLREQASRRPLAIAKTDREHLAQLFTPPPRTHRARSVLHDSSTVLIDGLPGSGRRTAALMLLHELPETTGSFHELPDTADDRTTSALDPHDISHGDRLLLDLSEVDESRYLAVQEEFFDFRSRLIEQRAHLVVVLPHHLAYLLRGSLRRFTVDIGRPRAMRLLARHLRCASIVPSAAELDSAELTSYLAQAPMRDVASLADRIRNCRDASGADRGFSHWLADSLVGLDDQTARVAADIRAEQNGRRRALLLALAMFHGTAPGRVLQATNMLLSVLSHPPDTTPRLDRSDLHAEFSAIGAETQPYGHVRFRIRGYDRAVRDHFWIFLPDLHGQLREWFRMCLATPGLDPTEREEAIGRFAVQSLRAGRPADLTWLAEQWTHRAGQAHLVADAAQVLAHGLADDHHGRYVRQHIYDWCTATETSRRLRKALILVCSEVMARSHPDQALVRLHHLARRSDGQLGEETRRAVVGLARSDNRLYRRMLDRLSTGISHGRWEVDLRLFVELADPVRLIRSPSVRACLSVGWAGVMGRPVAFWAAPTEHWLNASGDPRFRDRALEVLAAGCATDVHVSGHLYRVALGWRRDGLGRADERADTVSLLLSKINSAQGIAPY